MCIWVLVIFNVHVETFHMNWMLFLELHSCSVFQCYKRDFIVQMHVEQACSRQKKQNSKYRQSS